MSNLYKFIFSSPQDSTNNGTVASTGGSREMGENLSLQGTVVNSNNCTANGSPPSQKQLPKVTLNTLNFNKYFKFHLNPTATNQSTDLPVSEKPSFRFHERGQSS